MAYLNAKYDRKDPSAFRLESNNKVVARIGALLSRDDFEMIRCLVESAYRQGQSDGSHERAEEIRIALGIESKN